MGEYSDDDLEDLPESALQQLEDNAIQSTQAPRLILPTISQQARAQAQAQAHTRRAYPDPPPFDALGLDDDEDDDGLDFDGSDVLSHSIGAMPRALAHPPVMQQQASRTSFPDRSQGHPSQARWKNQIPPPPPGPISRPIPSQSFRPPALHNAPSHSPQPTNFPRGFAPPPPRYAPSQSQSQLHPNAVTALEQRLRSLESELHISRGEAAILRANSTKSQAAADAEIALLRKQNAEYLAKHERAVQAAVQAEKTAATEMKFMQQEMQEMMARARRRDTGAGACAGGSPGNTTPKKGSRTWGVADGFDGMDLVASPSKNVPRTKSAPMPSIGERTPTKAKRKRPVDSPVPPLDTTEDVVMADGRDVVDVASKPAAVAGPPAALHSLPFDFLPLILDHSSAHGRPPTFDSLARYFYPSDPTTSFSSIIFQSLPTKVDPVEPMRILSSFSSLIINLWARCLQEEFFLPIRELVSLLTFTLQLHSVFIVPPLIDKLLPVAQTTLHVIADVRAANCSDEALGANPDFQALRDSLDSAAVVALLNLCALVCATATEPLSGGDDTPREAFWKGFAMETVSLVLGSKQPLPDITGMLEMLATSVLRDSIGPVVPGKEPALVAGTLIDKLSRFLMYPPASARSPAQRHAVVAAALRTLVSFSAREFAAREMALHENLVLRIIAMLSRSVDELYDQELSSGTLLLNPQEQQAAVDDALEAADGDGDGDGDVGGLCAVISLGVLLLHGLLTDPPTAGLVGLERKFEAWKGGGHKYLVLLCRLNFAEDDGVLEAGVDVETAERAHELLEMLVSAEGGRDVGEVFGSPE
ncbi:related to uvs-3 - [Cephalotrichum gorgonifer]|uniref:Related to uvs-3 n=1 Tax=Cephalotrichum gorgonifer TaxID=2041049 RepID=A0AAE8MYB5_9PEZI|nr:related to uvs-3 - [Cephalotrichum gorgonifer]